MSNVADIVRYYISARDKMRQVNAAAAELIKPIRDEMNRIEAAFLEKFQRDGIDSIKTEAGTSYRSMRTTFTVSDREAFLDFITDEVGDPNGERWALLGVGVDKAAMERFVADTKSLPPGITMRQEYVCNMRRAPGSSDETTE